MDSNHRPPQGLPVLFLRRNQGLRSKSSPGERSPTLDGAELYSASSGSTEGRLAESNSARSGRARHYWRIAAQARITPQLAATTALWYTLNRLCP